MNRDKTHSYRTTEAQKTGILGKFSLKCRVCSYKYVACEKSTQRKRGKSMTQVITVANQKGGTGKTTSAVNLLAAATFKKKRALLIDLDAQGNASYITGADPARGIPRPRRRRAPSGRRETWPASPCRRPWGASCRRGRAPRPTRRGCAAPRRSTSPSHP